MTQEPARWAVTTHDWTARVDLAHLEQIRADPTRFAPGGVLHLVAEVLAYAGDEAVLTGGGTAVVTMSGDGSITVVDDGRGTDTRPVPATDTRGPAIIRKPVMATRDVRFFDADGPPLLADGSPRRGMSVVAALSSWLVHTNRRVDGAWTQRYACGRPVGELAPVAGDGTTGTAVHFRPDARLVRPDRTTREEVEALARAVAPGLTVRIS